MSTDTIKEFLVSIGYKHEESALKSFEKGINQATKVVVGFAVAVEASAVAVSLGVTKMASNLEALYFASVRTGTAASSLKAFDRAAQSFGASAGEALHSAESLARFFRQNPAGGSYVNALLGQVGQSAYDSKGQLKDQAELMESIGTLFASNTRRGMGFQNYQISGLLGINEKTMLAIQDGSFVKRLEEIKRYNKESGLDGAAAGAHRFMESLRKLGDQLFVFGVRVVDVLQKKLGLSLDKITDWLRTDGQMLANKVSQIVGMFIDDFNRMLDWLKANAPLIEKRIGEAWGAISEVYAIVKPAFAWIFNMLVKLDKATDGWSTKIIALTALLSKIGAFEIIAGLLGAGKAIRGIGLALEGMGGGAAVLAGIAASLLSITGAIGAGIGLGYLIDKLMPKTTEAAGSSVADWIGEQQEKWHNLRHPFDPVIKGLTDQGLSRSQAIGIASNMFQESSLNPNARSVDSKGREHYGMMQWDPERQADFKRVMGKDIHGSSAEDQDKFAAHEIRFNPRFAPAWKLMQAHRADTGADAAFNAAVFSRMVEKPGNEDAEAAQRAARAYNISQKTEINIHGATDPKETARLIEERMKRVNAALAREFAPTAQ